MKRRLPIISALTAAITAIICLCACCKTSDTGLKSGQILHTVIFDLKYPVGSPEAQRFLDDGVSILTSVPGVIDFQALKQCSHKNDYQYGFLMRFNNQAEFDAYTAHPDHCKFVKERWDTEVTRFQESDFINL